MLLLNSFPQTRAFNNVLALILFDLFLFQNTSLSKLWLVLPPLIFHWAWLWLLQVAERLMGMLKYPLKVQQAFRYCLRLFCSCCCVVLLCIHKHVTHTPIHSQSSHSPRLALLLQVTFLGCIIVLSMCLAGFLQRGRELLDRHL